MTLCHQAGIGNDNPEKFITLTILPFSCFEKIGQILPIHRVDKHFVPGLIINGNLLEMSPDGSGGIMVGTKTSYVQGKYMKEAGIGRYRDVVRTELEKRVEEAFK